jgi:membrane fusion protein (multidrug efflux system)
MNSVAPDRRRRARQIGFLVLTVAIIAAGGAWAAHWARANRGFESTDDAYVSARLVQITSQVPGTVLGVPVDDTQAVKRGQLLVALDPADAHIALASSEAELARAVRAVRGLFAQRDGLRTDIVRRQSDLQRAQDDLNRRQNLLSDGAVSGEEIAHARDAVAVARAALDGAREQLNATEAQIQGTTTETHPQVLSAEAAVRDAALALRRTQLRAPVDGVVSQRVVQIGQRVAAGVPLMVVVPLQGAWVDANFKEVQLRNMRVGQPVNIVADLYGGAIVFHGKVAGFAAGSGSAFALLPPQNASGNWIKIVQRVPVRIAVDPQQLAEHPLRVGLSMTARVDVHDTSGPLMSEQSPSAPLPELASAGDDPELDARIRQIVAENAGHIPAAAVAQSATAGQP